MNLMMLFIQLKFHEACKQFASVNWISFLCRYLFKMMNIYTIDSEFEVKLWCTNTIPCSLSVLLLLIFLGFFVWTKIAIMWHLCTCKQCVTLCTKLLCIVCLVLYCNLMFCFCKISIQMLNLKVCFCNYFLKLETMMWCVCCCSRKNIYQEWLDENFWS